MLPHTGACPPTPGQPVRDYPLTATWLIVYLLLHMFWQQCVFGSYVYVILRAGFIAAVIAYLVIQRRAADLPRVFMGDTRPRWSTCAAAAIITLGLRYVLYKIQPFAGSESTVRYVVDHLLIPPLNEEIVFRSLFIGVLLYGAKQSKPSAVFLAALAFAVCHNLREVNFYYLMASGTLYGFAWTFRGGGLVAAALAHLVWNAFPLLVP